jgi:predicted permease
MMKPDRDDDLAREIRAHLELEAEERVADGVSPDEAQYAARRAFGNTTRISEDARAVWTTRWVEQFQQDLRYGFRLLWRNVGFTTMVVLSLAAGIGANTAIFSLINGLMLRPLPVREPERLVLFSGWGAGILIGTPRPGRLGATSFPLYEQLRDENQSFDGLAAQDSAVTSCIVLQTGVADERSQAEARGRVVSANYFDVVGVQAFRGRTFLPDDQTAPGANPVVVLSHGYWQSRFGGNPAIVGAILRVNERPYTVVGITAPEFNGSRVGDGPTDLWVPITMQAEFMRAPSRLSQRDQFWLLLIGRLKPGVSMASAETNVNLTLQRFLTEDPGLASDAARRQAVRISLDPGARGVSLMRDEFRAPLLTLMAGVGLLLLIVCLNVSHLLLARGISRQREMSIRNALGASRGRIVRQLFTEGLLLSLLGATAGALFSGWLSSGLVSLAASRGSAIALDVSVDIRVLSFTVLLAFATAIVVGLVPVWQALGIDLDQALRATSRSTTSRSRGLISRLLLTSQVAFSLMLLVGAGLLTGSLSKLQNVEKGFNSEQALLADINPRMAGFDEEQVLVLYDELLGAVTALPGVRSASLSQLALLSGGGRSQNRETISLTGSSQPLEQASVQIVIVTPGYFDAVGMKMATGRAIEREDRRTAPNVAVVNQTLARRFFGGDVNAVGKRFRDWDNEDVEVVGVLSDAKVNGFRRDPEPTVYRPVAQESTFLSNLTVRASGEPARLADQVRRAVRSVSSSLPVANVRTLRSQVEGSLRQERLLAILSGTFGIAALLLVCLGLYGVISQWAAQRTREVGVRLALGATGADVRWMVLRDAFTIVSAGMIAGIPAALATSRSLRGLLYGLTPTDPTTLIAALTALFGVATIAAYVPARRASRVDPMVALRAD